MKNKHSKETIMNPSFKRAAFLLMAGILLLAACAPAPAPTQDPAEIQQQIQEAVALTVAAQEAEAEQQVTPEPSNTPLPTQTEAGPATETPVLPTATPFTVVPPTLVPNSGGGGGVAVTPLEYDCTSRDRRPYDNTYFISNKEFDIKWTIVNTGTKSWPAGKDVKYFSGPQMSTTTLVELPAMAPGDTFVVNLDAVAPQKQGFHVMTWIVEGQLCYPYVAIIVEN
jgi:hypothetical protein